MVTMTRIRQFRSRALVGLLAIGLLQCGESTPPTTPAEIAPVSGDGQTAPAGQPLANPLIVVVTDEFGNAVPGVSVTWSAQGGGNVSATATETGSNGRASVTRVLGPTTGEQTTTATVSGLDGSPVTFVSTATEDVPPPDNISISTNPPVAALTSEVFDPVVQPVVTVTTSAGSPVAGAEVTASIGSGGGQLEGRTTATTDANGVARFLDLGINGTGDHTIEFTAGTSSVTSSPVSVSALPTEATTGKWGPVVNWDIVPLHMSLLPNGKIFAFGRSDVADTMGMPRIWDPASGPPNGLPEIHVDDMLFCAGHTLMPNGSLMVNGGHHKDAAGIKVTYFFSQDGAPQKAADMAFGRWYPTTTVLPDGNVLTMAGRDESGTVVGTPELWTGNSWVQLTGGVKKLPYYPRNFVDPKDGRIFYAGEQVQSRWFDYRGTGSWTSGGPQHIWGFNRDYGTAAMYDTGKILYAGGGGDLNWSCECSAKADRPTATAERIDLNQTSPQWQSAGSMSAPRRHLNSTILPDGQVLVTGGTRGGGFVDFSQGNAVKTAEVWNPATNQWTTLAAQSRVRVYHSVALLLPNGTVLSGASGDAVAGDGVTRVPDEKNHEIFEPPYLFKGVRPSITSAPASVGYGETFSVATPNAAQITDVRWIRLGSVTHAFDMSQRANTLGFQVSNGAVEVQAPSGPNLAPPGHYLLFILNRNGVPSAGKVVKVQ
jgi:hypothetical protein